MNRLYGIFLFFSSMGLTYYIGMHALEVSMRWFSNLELYWPLLTVSSMIVLVSIYAMFSGPDIFEDMETNCEGWR